MKTFKYTLLIVVLIAILLGTGYGLGLRFHEGHIVHTGSVNVTLPSEEGLLFLDEKQIKSAVGESEFTFSKVSPGEHTLVYVEEGSFPWQRSFVLAPREKLAFIPFTTTVNFSGFFINPPDEEYAKLRSSFTSSKGDSEVAPLLSDDGMIMLWTIGTTVFLDWRGDEATIPDIFCGDGGDVCHTRLLFFESATPINNATFYKDRNDVVIIASGDAVFAVDALINGFRNFQPLYDGTGVDFRKKSDTELYVSDQDGKQFLVVNY
jgi:hypothetical protein